MKKLTTGQMSDVNAWNISLHQTDIDDFHIGKLNGKIT